VEEREGGELREGERERKREGGRERERKRHLIYLLRGLVQRCWSMVERTRVGCQIRCVWGESVLQCDAVCCDVLRCVAVCCGVFIVLQCVAVCCSVLLCVGHIVSKERVYWARGE